MVRRGVEADQQRLAGPKGHAASPRLDPERSRRPFLCGGKVPKQQGVPIGNGGHLGSAHGHGHRPRAAGELDDPPRRPMVGGIEDLDASVAPVGDVDASRFVEGRHGGVLEPARRLPLTLGGEDPGIVLVVVAHQDASPRGGNVLGGQRPWHVGIETASVHAVKRRRRPHALPPSARATGRHH